MEAYENKLESVDELQHLGEFRIKPHFRFGTHEEDLLAHLYSKPDLNVLVIASNLVEEHHFLNQRHAHFVSWTGACINDPPEVIDIVGTQPHLSPLSPCELLPTRPSTKAETPAAHRATSATPRSKRPVVIFNQLSSDGEEFNFEFRDRVEEDNLLYHIRGLNCMYRELCGIDHLIHSANRNALFF